MSSVVVDTNVLIVANNNAPQASPDCIVSCINKLVDIKESMIISVDSSYRIFNEYMDYNSFSGQPGMGDVFFKWLWNNQANIKHCEQVPITLSDDGLSFEEFPDDPALAAFDPSDRKFVAVANASQYNPNILNAVDSDWWNFNAQLESHGINIEILCPGQFT